MKEYVLGFVFVGDDRILLQRKNRGGKFLENKLNGLGGKIENGEYPIDAMNREYVEETGDTRIMNWIASGAFSDNETYKVYVFYRNVVEYFYDGLEFNSTDENFEELLIINIDEINTIYAKDIVDNLEFILDNVNEYRGK